MLRRLVQHQQLVICRVQTQLKFVLSFLGIDEDEIPVNDTPDHADRPLALQNPSDLQQDTPAAGTEGRSDQSSLSEVARRKRTSKASS